MAVEGVGFGHSSEDDLSFFLFLVVNGVEFVDVFYFVLDDGFELMDDFLEVFGIVDVVVIDVKDGVVELLRHVWLWMVSNVLMKRKLYILFEMVFKL